MGGGESPSILDRIAGSVTCTEAFRCSTDLDSYGGIVLWLMIMIYMFKQLGTICDEYFVPALEVIVERLEMSNDVAGATFMAAGSSAPELFTSLVATFLIVNEGGVGTIVGSAIFNILVIVGATGYVACKEQSLPIWWYPLTRDCVFYSISIGELYLVLYDHEVRWYEGVLMVVTYLFYCVYMKFNPWLTERLGIGRGDEAGEKDTASEEVQDVSSWQDPVQEVKVGSHGEDREESPEITPELGCRPLDDADCQIAGVNADVVQMVKLSLPNAVPVITPTPVVAGKECRDRERDHSAAYNRAESRASFDAKGASCTGGHPKWSMRESQNSSQPAPISVVPEGKGEVVAVIPNEEDATAPASEPEEAGCRRYCRDPMEVVLSFIMPNPEKNYWLLFSLSIFFIGAATYLMVDATNRMGIILKIPPLVMGLIFLAAGTSIPDAMGSIAVAKQGEGDMAVANALGSNVFDILIGLGVPWTLRCLMRGPVDFGNKTDSLLSDICILAGILALFIGTLFFNAWKLSRRIGQVFLFFYLLFVIYNILAVWVFKTKEADE